MTTCKTSGTKHENPFYSGTYCIQRRGCYTFQAQQSKKIFICPSSRWLLIIVITYFFFTKSSRTQKISLVLNSSWRYR